MDSLGFTSLPDKRFHLRNETARLDHSLIFQLYQEMELIMSTLEPKRVVKTLEGYTKRSKELKLGLQATMKLINLSINVS